MSAGVSEVIRTASFSGILPALLASTSIWPNSALARLTSPYIPSLPATSTTRLTDAREELAVLGTVYGELRSRSQMKTAAPSWRNFLAIALPMPLPPL
jgi:hypothetical protein